ncbi:hypothetical protein G6F35_016555 [Rhizopus arrhizus]|nr:hypothetical protein G6F35_016555 [Rhizopus arrhizus]
MHDAHERVFQVDATDAGHQGLRGVQGHDAAALEHGDAAAQGFRFFQVVRGQHDRVAGLVQARDEFPQGAAQRLRHQHAALHAAGQRAHVVVGLVGQAQVEQDLVDPVVVVAQAEVAGLDAQGLAHREERVVDQLLRHDAQRAPRRLVVGHDVVATDGGAPGRGVRQAGKDGDQG